MAALMLQTRQAGALLDPRTKILLILTITSVVIGGGNDGLMMAAKPALTSIPFILFLAERKWRAAAFYAVLYTAAFFGGWLLTAVTWGPLNFLLVACCGLLTQFMPGIAMGSYLVNTTTVSEFMAAMERMHLSQKLTIPLSVMFRFFPTAMEEHHAIGDAMRMRGIRFGGGKPAKIAEYRLVPLMVSCVKIGEELSAAALTRGLGAPVRRTNICRIGFHGLDAVAISICLAGFAALMVDRFA